MRLACIGLTTLIVLATSNTVFAKARFMPKTELIETADIIAVVEVTQIDDASAKGTHWTYRQAADALTVQTLKGQLPMHFVIHANKDFICACATYEAKARYLVFLRREGKLFTTVNHQLGQFKVTDDKIKWYSDDHSLAVGEHPLGEVIREVEEAVTDNSKRVVHFDATAANEGEEASSNISGLFKP